MSQKYSTDAIISAIRVTDGMIKLTFSEGGLEWIKPEAAILRVRRSPQDYTMRLRADGSLKWIRYVAQFPPPPWIKCYRTANSAVFAPWPGTLDKQYSRASLSVG